MTSKKMKKKCKNSFLDMANLKNILKGKRWAFYTKKERAKNKRLVLNGK